MISNFYHLESEGFEGGYENPLDMVKEWRKRPNTRIFVSKWATPEGGEGTLIGEPIDITHLALHLIENEREREQGRVR